MSFSYKTLNSTDLTLTSYIANKLWEVKNSTLSENGITIYIGENLPLNRNNIFDPIDDIETSNEEYRRLVFESIKHLYYENYVSGSVSGEFFQSSSYFNYDQTTLTSGSMISSFKTLPTLTGSANIKVDAYDESIRYDVPTSIYDQSIFDPNRGGKVVLIAVDKEVFGSGLSPNSVFISGSGYYLRDDGEGNLYNYQNEVNYARYNSAIYDKDIYLEIVNSRTPQLEYVGNVFYSHGMIIITNENYLCAFGAPPSAVNDYFSYFNMDTPQIFDPLGNDISDCGSINFDSFVAHPIAGKTFPDFIYDNGFLSITPNHKSVIPGNYKIGYTIENVYGLKSNTGSLNLEITSEPLRITNIVSSSTCYGSTVEQPVTFSIDYGVPYYSYSLDYGETYTPVDNLFNVRVSGSIIPSDNSMVYIKDYLGEIISSSLDLWYPEIIFTPILTRVNCDNESNGEITVTGNEGLTTSINGDTYFDIPHTFTGLSNGIYTIYAKNEYDCIRTKTTTVVSAPPISLVSTLRHINCFGSSTGQISLNVINPSTNYSTVWKNSSNVTVGTSNTLSNVPVGNYTVFITDNNINGCQSISANYTLTGSAQLIASSTASYMNAESTSIIINAIGGVAPYTYYAINNSNGTPNISSSPTVALSGLGLNEGSFTTYVVDSLGCSSNNVLIDVFGRRYMYDGVTCETQTPLPPPPVTCGIPTLLSTTTSGGRIFLNWTLGAGTPSVVSISSSTDGGITWSGENTGSPTSPRDAGNIPTVATTYRIRTICTGGEISGYSNSITYNPPPPAPYTIAISRPVTPGTGPSTGTITVNNAPVTLTLAAMGGGSSGGSTTGNLNITGIGSFSTANAPAFQTRTTNVTINSNGIFTATLSGTFVGTSGNNVDLS